MFHQETTLAKGMAEGVQERETLTLCNTHPQQLRVSCWITFPPKQKIRQLKPVEYLLATLTVIRCTAKISTISFQHYGTITAISNLTCKSPKGGCCFAFIQFIDVDSAHNAVEAVNGRKYHGYALEVRLAEFKGSSNATPIRPLMATDQVVAPAQKVVPVNFEPVFKKRPFSGAELRLLHKLRSLNLTQRQ
ncbi:hypothetical protein EB796_000303 [Bugula neritina]|uniref:RRM domain-containing protein n=1 Tax=Bugula neritina TaxID=10212 RepID=A0A7J7KT87_BUGNE|nr:hypothetical protein EB796_000303 [Bugula neritina]